MQDELIVFSHNDLDMAGSILCIEYKMPFIKKKYFYTNYSDIKKQVDDIEQYVKQYGNTHCLMTDISWSTSPEELHRICNMFEKVTLIDHHLYPDNFFESYPKLKVYYDKNKSGALLTYEYFKINNPDLKEIVDLTDVYDLWQDDHIDFEKSQDLNRFFWEIGKDKFITDIINNNYKLPYYYNTVINELRKKFTEAIEKFENRKLIHRTDKITIAFVDEWFNEILVKDMAEGKDFVINVTTYGIFKIRINRKSNIPDSLKNELRLRLTGTNDVGHMNAFPFKMKNQISFENIMAEIKNVINTINDTCYKG